MSSGKFRILAFFLSCTECYPSLGQRPGRHLCHRRESDFRAQRERAAENSDPGRVRARRSRSAATNICVRQRGYLYYTLTPGKEDICRKEWADLKAVAGTGQGIGFGFRYDTTTRLRKATDKLDAPDPYPIGVGLTRMGNHGHQARIIAGIKEALQSG